MTKPFHAGHAARNGVFAALVAREGLTASDSALEGRQGYAAAFSQATLAPDAFDHLGQRWQVLTSGIAVKPYPSCALTHSAIDALLAMRAHHGLGAEQVAEIEVGVNHVVPDVLRHDRPTNGLERKFSMQFCAAAALASGRVDLGSFDDGPVADAGTRELMGRVRMVVDPTLPDGLSEQAWTRVTVRLRDGRTLDSAPRGASGHPEQPLSDAQLRDKFLACATPVIGADEADGVATQLTHLEDIPDVRALTARLVTARD